MSRQQGRLIALRAGDPAENMAVDQALHESVDRGGIPVLRLYTWSRPTLSLGYFQSFNDRRGHAESTDLVCVRRSTGGGAIVHHHELTYSLAIPIDASLAGPRLDLYQQTHLALIQTLTQFGVSAVPFGDDRRELPAAAGGDPFLCFQRRTDEDLIVAGYKVLGSAQRKARQAVLQHGSLLLRASPWAPQLPGIRDLTAHPIPLARLAESLTKTIGQALSIDWTEGEISAAERSRAEEIEVRRFGSNHWLHRR
jgi:lipoate-protein ligase A